MQQQLTVKTLYHKFTMQSNTFCTVQGFFYSTLYENTSSVIRCICEIIVKSVLHAICTVSKWMIFFVMIHLVFLTIKNKLLFFYRQCLKELPRLTVLLKCLFSQVKKKVWLVLRIIYFYWLTMHYIWDNCIHIFFYECCKQPQMIQIPFLVSLVSVRHYLMIKMRLMIKLQL